MLSTLKQQQCEQVWQKEKNTLDHTSVFIRGVPAVPIVLDLTFDFHIV